MLTTCFWGKYNKKSIYLHPGPVAQLVGTSSHTPKGWRFDSWLGRIQEATHRCFSHQCFFSHPHVSPSPSQSINQHILQWGFIYLQWLQLHGPCWTITALNLYVLEPVHPPPLQSSGRTKSKLISGRSFILDASSQDSPAQRQERMPFRLVDST